MVSWLATANPAISGKKAPLYLFSSFPIILKLFPRIYSPLMAWNDFTGLLMPVLNGRLMYFHWVYDMQVDGSLYITWREVGRIREENWTSLVRHILLSTCLSKGEIFWCDANFNIVYFTTAKDHIFIYPPIFISKNLKCDRLHSLYQRKNNVVVEYTTSYSKS